MSERVVEAGAKGGWFMGTAGAIFVIVLAFLFLFDPHPLKYQAAAADIATTTVRAAPEQTQLPPLDAVAYDKKLLYVAHVATSSPWYQAFLSGTAAESASTMRFSTTTVRQPWPVRAAYPNAGALLPFNRIVAYYGNFYSTQMGVLGAYDRETVVAKLLAAAAEWRAADPNTPVIPAIDYIAVTAQGSPQVDGTYRLRMPADQIQKALDMAGEVHGQLILDVQVGKSTLPQELPLLEPYLKLPNVHLAIDPEFSMKGSAPPGTIIGTFTSADINFAALYLQKIVQANNLPPKILVVHRFTEDMVTNYKQIKPLPEVQIVMDMDGWGFPDKKINTYKYVVAGEPVQFTGFKLFYKADLRPPSTRMLTPAEVLRLTPAPSFIQYQ